MKVEKNVLKQCLLIMGSALFVFVGFQLSFGNMLGKSSFFVQIIGLICILFFGLIGIVLFIDFFKFKSALILDNNGIENNASATGSYIVKWDNIKSMHLTTTSGKNFLIIKVYDVQAIYDQVNVISRWWMKVNENTYDTPVFIPFIMLDVKPQLLLAQLKQYKIKFTE